MAWSLDVVGGWSPTWPFVLIGRGLSLSASAHHRWRRNGSGETSPVTRRLYRRQVSDDEPLSGSACRWLVIIRGGPSSLAGGYRVAPHCHGGQQLSAPARRRLDVGSSSSAAAQWSLAAEHLRGSRVGVIGVCPSSLEGRRHWRRKGGDANAAAGHLWRLVVEIVRGWS